MTNSIRPGRLVSLRWKGETRTCESRKPVALIRMGAKATAGAVRWLETEGPEGHSHEAKRPAWAMRSEEPERHLCRAGVRALIVAMKPGNSGGAKGCRKMETRCRNRMESARW